MYDLTGQKPHGAKAKQTDRSIINSDEEERELELKCQKLDKVPVIEIWQLTAMTPLLLWDLVAAVMEHVVEQQK